jgi:L-alanine-DL-glutamate epimerase-like enolase superfamily enzyme
LPHTVTGGRIELRRAPGLGIDIDDQALEQYTVGRRDSG